ncbi:S-ribosylhomocysteine lyase [Salmonella bongori N268-08]|uniref:S-ribosylhomocysteine lyase n=1 Tax=Salmonella bongori N268-08 TaxID=1197719 RepID=S5NBM3_SALBN|nr:S-ribosylhomocysteine lyase [Salmonella bongori N268-08]
MAKISSLKTGMMITNARLSYTQTRPGTKSSVYFKKIIGGD